MRQILIVDFNLQWWTANHSDVEVSTFIHAIAGFGAAFLCQSPENLLTFIGAFSGRSRILWSNLPLKSSLGFFDILDSYRNSLTVDAFGHFQNEDSLVVEPSQLNSALCKALCYCNRQNMVESVRKDTITEILILTASDATKLQYMSTMNCMFTAQKQKIAISAAVLGENSTLLQQACDVTGGFYFNVPSISLLQQCLLWLFCGEGRLSMNRPENSLVDFRAACFCHRRLIDIGFVCSVCLSVFCEFSPICSTCQLLFVDSKSP